MEEFKKANTAYLNAADIDALGVEDDITPFSINDDKDTITNLIAANGGKPIISQRESIEFLGWSNDTEKTLAEIQDQDKLEELNLTV